MLRGRYKIISNLSSGGFSKTYLAEDRDLPGNPYCVVKQLRSQFTNEFVLQEAIRLFDNEAEVLYRLGNHDQIPRLLAHFGENQRFYLVQEFIDGNDLSKELTPGTQWSEEQVISFLQAVLKILEFVHQQNVIHRDIKPANLIRRTSDGKIVLIDFGAVKEITSFGGKTVAIGTPGYMPSEQSNGQPQLCSDIYALGMIGIQALTGIQPEKLPKDRRTLEVIWNKQAVSPQLAVILDKMVRYQFSQRYQSASEVLQALTSLIKINNKWSRTKKIALALLLVAILFSITVLASPKIRQIFGFTSHASSTDTAFSIYENSTYGIKMKYPKTWMIQYIGDIFTGELVKILAPQTSGATTYQAGVTVEIVNLKQPMSLDEYTNLSVNEITQFLPQARIEESDATTLAEIPAQKVVYSGKEEQHNVKRMAVWTLKNNKAYIITYTAEISKYDEFLKTAQEIINSLKIS